LTINPQTHLGCI